MDNGFWYRAGVTLRNSLPLFSGAADTSGRVAVDESRTTDPPVVAQFMAGDFDFTLITLHLTFADGNTTESATELGHVLDQLDAYFKAPGHDPDVVCNRVLKLEQASALIPRLSAIVRISDGVPASISAIAAIDDSN